MSMSFGLGTNLSTSQKLTPQMQQAIKLLQLSSLELEQEVQMKLDSNPLLERVEEDDIEADDFASDDLLDDSFADDNFINDNFAKEAFDEHDNDYNDYDTYSDAKDSDLSDLDGSHSYDDVDSSDSFDSLTDNALFSDYENSNSASSSHDNTQSANANANDSSSSDNDFGSEDKVADSADRMTDNALGELEVDTDWDDVYTHAATSLASPNLEDMDDYQGATAANLQDHIRWQLNFKHLSEIDILIADYLIDSMDDYGFIQIDFDALVQSFDTMASFYQWDDKIEEDQIHMVLHVIQSCEPLGVGARNLAECLQIQLKKLPATTPYLHQAKQLLTAHEYLVSNNIKALTQKTGLKKSDIAPSIELLRTLNPSPGMGFTDAQPDYGLTPESYDIPDVLVNTVQSDDGEPVWQVKLNPSTLPKLRINQEYANLVKRSDDSPDNVYLRDNLTDARLFIRSIEERNQNLLKVATCIVKRQQEFLLQGPTAMKPMILKDVAEEVDLHESTVSRLTTSKSILTPQGLFSLKHFFSSHVSSKDGDVSSTAICAMIEALIAQEDPKKPLSDSAVKKALETEGIEIARRTVAKYREALNIGSSTQRKLKF